MASAVVGLRGAVFSDVCDSVGDWGVKRFGDWLAKVKLAAPVSCLLKLRIFTTYPALAAYGSSHKQAVPQ